MKLFPFFDDCFSWSVYFNLLGIGKLSEKIGCQNAKAKGSRYCSQHCTFIKKSSGFALDNDESEAGKSVSCTTEKGRHKCKDHKTAGNKQMPCKSTHIWQRLIIYVSEYRINLINTKTLKDQISTSQPHRYPCYRAKNVLL